MEEADAAMARGCFDESPPALPLTHLKVKRSGGTLGLCSLLMEFPAE